MQSLTSVVQTLASIDLNEKKEPSKRSIDRVTDLFLSIDIISKGLKNYIENAAKRSASTIVMKRTANFFAEQTGKQLLEYKSKVREDHKSFGLVEQNLHLNQVLKTTIYFTKKENGKVSYYFLLGKVGGGTFNDVYQCIKLPKGKFRALRLYNTIGNAADFKREMSIHDQLNQCASLTNSVVKKYETISSRQQLGAVLEFYPLNLHQIMTRLNSQQIKTLLGGIFKSASNLHQEGFIHGDLKPANIMIEAQKTKEGSIQLQPRICDFGSTFSLKEVTDHGDCTAHYKAPELFTFSNEKDIYSSGEEYGFENDCWSLGVIAYELKFRRLPAFCQEMENAPIEKESFFASISKVVSQLSESSDPYDQMLVRLFEVDRKKRLTAEEGCLLLESLPLEAFEVQS